MPKSSDNLCATQRSLKGTLNPLEIGLESYDQGQRNNLLEKNDTPVFCRVSDEEATFSKRYLNFDYGEASKEKKVVHEDRANKEVNYKLEYERMREKYENVKLENEILSKRVRESNFSAELIEFLGVDTEEQAAAKVKALSLKSKESKKKEEVEF